MCIFHCYIKEKDINCLKEMGVDIEYIEKWSICDVLHTLTDIKAIEYIIEHYSSYWML